MARLDDILAPARSLLTAGRFGPATTLRTVNDHERAEPSANALIRGLGVDATAYTIARVIASEVGSLPTPYWLCVAEALLNEADSRGRSVLELVTTPGKDFPEANEGFYGEQRTRSCASKRDPSKAQMAVAEAAMRHRALGLAKGARRWVSLKTQDGGLQNGRPLKYNAVTICEKRAEEGWAWIGDVFHPQSGELLILPYVLCMMRQVGKVTALAGLGSTLAMINAGRAGRTHQSADDAAREDDGEGDFPWVAVAVAGAVAPALL